MAVFSARAFAWLRDCVWLDASRARAYTWLLAAAALAVFFACMASNALGLNRGADPIGGDFVSFWAASRLALAGRADLAYDVSAHWAVQRTVLGPDVGYAAFFYPPPALLLYLPLGLAPYSLALFGWLGLTGYAALRVMRRFWPGLGVGPFLAFPAVTLNAVDGQNGFVSTALIGGGLALMDRRPAMAGALLGAMVFKPHLAVLLPFPLILSRRWSVLAAMAATSLILCALSLALFGVSTWSAFLHGSVLARRALEENMIGYVKMQSVFAAARLLHAPVGLAWAVQSACFVAALAGLFFLYRNAWRPQGEAAAIVCATLLATPFLLHYDLMLCAIPLCWLTAEGLRAGFAPFEKTTLAAVFLLPLISQIEASAIGLPLAPLLIVAFMIVILRRAHKARCGRPAHLDGSGAWRLSPAANR